VTWVSDRAPADPPTAEAFAELELLVRNLGGELAAFRRRAHEAEARLRTLGRSPGGDATAEERVAALEAENARLRERLAEAAARTRGTLERVRFLRQQQALEGER
jgi:predicted RNase H-like nuclease (RuvC/YqgF family)